MLETLGKEIQQGKYMSVTKGSAKYNKYNVVHAIFTIRPASTVGTSVNLLPSVIPKSWSFPELRRLERTKRC